jgi:alcohol dehydrogenase
VQRDTDVIVGVDAVTICGTDLHILKGDVPEVTAGTVLGHEAVGTVEEVGRAIRSFRPGDRVLVSCIAGCGTCRFCREGHYGQCTEGGGWALGHTIDGVQAQYARVPFGDLSLHPLPQGVTDEAAVLLADILPTSYEVGVLNGRVRPGDTVVIVGAGPIGLAAVMTATLYSPGCIIVVDPAEPRRDAAKSLLEPALEVVRSMTGGLGADVVMEAVGIPATFEMCTALVRPGGRVANIGVHGAPATIHLETLWIKNVTITTGLVDTSSTPRLLKLLADGQLDPTPIITHRFGLDQFMEAYDVFGRPAETGALKVVLQRG